MAKLKKKDSPPGTPLQTPIQTPERRIQGNSFEPLQNDSDGEETSQATINADDRQVEIESEQSDPEPAPTSIPDNPPSPTEKEPAPISTPDDLKQRPTSSGPIAEILPTNAERLRTSVPIFASEFANTMGKLFPEISNPSNLKLQSQIGKTAGNQTLDPSNRTNSKHLPLPSVTDLKPPAAVPLPPMPPSAIEMKQLATEIFGDDSKLSASNKPKQSRSSKPPPVASPPSKLSPVSLQEVSNAGVNTLGSNDGKQPARVNLYNSAARISRPAGHSGSIIHASLIEEQRKELAVHQQAEQTIVFQKQSNNPDRALESAE
jgi:hypothetical protein